jgi:hypothetical protein
LIASPELGFLACAGAGVSFTVSQSKSGLNFYTGDAHWQAGGFSDANLFAWIR